MCFFEKRLWLFDYSLPNGLLTLQSMNASSKLPRPSSQQEAIFIICSSRVLQTSNITALVHWDYDAIPSSILDARKDLLPRKHVQRILWASTSTVI
ncbi:hypothetical protein ACFX15_040629 [Malus domestica]